MTTRLSRTVGALLGVHAGDALGATLEFNSHAQIKAAHPDGLRTIVGGGPFGWSPGHATDDTDLTRAILLAYADDILHAAFASAPSAEPHKMNVTYRAAEYFASWYTGHWPDPAQKKGGNTPKDVGGSTAQGIITFVRTLDPLSSGTGPGRAGNGSLMRCIPTALFQPDQTWLVAESQTLSGITHADESCKVSCAAYNAMVAALVAGAEVSYAVARGLEVAIALEDGRGGDVYEAIRLGKKIDLRTLAQDGPSREQFPGGCSGHVLESLSLAVAAVLDDRSFEDVLVDVVRVGQDTDTNGAIAGGLLGARDGEEAIPRQWVEVLQFGSEFKEIATAIHEVQYGGKKNK